MKKAPHRGHDRLGDLAPASRCARSMGGVMIWYASLAGALSLAVGGCRGDGGARTVEQGPEGAVIADAGAADRTGEADILDPVDPVDPVDPGDAGDPGDPGDPRISGRLGAGAGEPAITRGGRDVDPPVPDALESAHDGDPSAPAAGAGGVDEIAGQPRRFPDLTAGQLRSVVIQEAREEDWLEALPYAEELAARRLDDPRFHELLGYVQRQAGRPALAARSYAVALELDPGNPTYLDGRARSLVAAGQVREGLNVLDNAARLRGNADLFDRLGDLAREAGLPDEAETAYRQALASTSGRRVETHRALVDLYQAIGDEESEMTHLRVLLYLEPGDAAVEERIRQLGEIPGPTFALEPSAVPGIPD